jgi:hypothetical protein
VEQKVPFCLIFLVSILCGFISCRALHPIPLEEPPQENARKEKTAPEKSTQEKTIPQQAPQQEAVQKKSSPERMPQKTIPPDLFARIYATDFGSFYGQANDALQDYAKTHKGNSFQISRLGSEAVILKGVYLREGGREKYVSTLTIKPIASKKCRLEIKFDAPAGGSSSPNPDKAAKEIFQIIEKGMQKPAQ